MGKGLGKQGGGNTGRNLGKGRKRAGSRGGDGSTGNHEASTANGKETLDEEVLSEQQLYVYVGHKPVTN